MEQDQWGFPLLLGVPVSNPCFGPTHTVTYGHAREPRGGIGIDPSLYPHVQ